MSPSESGDHGSLAARFGALFDGRHDAYGLSTDHGVECWRNDGHVVKYDHCDVMLSHLRGEQDYGVYPMVWDINHEGVGKGPELEWNVKWVCVDLDIAAPGKRRYDFETAMQAQDAADRLTVAAGVNGMSLWPEVTKSGGVHVWGFLDEWTPAEQARHATLWLCGEADVPTTEVNPKQTSLPSADSLGNFVRLPFFGATGTGRAARTVRGPLTWVPMALDAFVAAAWNQRTPAQVIRDLAGRYIPPMAPSPMPYVGEPIEVDKDWIRSLPPLLKAILKGGMGRSHDRSSWIYYLACTCAEEGLSPEDGLAYIEVADALHSTKYQNRPDADERYREIIERAYGQASRD